MTIHVMRRRFFRIRDVIFISLARTTSMSRSIDTDIIKYMPDI